MLILIQHESAVLRAAFELHWVLKNSDSFEHPSLEHGNGEGRNLSPYCTMDGCLQVFENPFLFSTQCNSAIRAEVGPIRIRAGPIYRSALVPQPGLGRKKCPRPSLEGALKSTLSTLRDQTPSSKSFNLNANGSTAVQSFSHGRPKPEILLSGVRAQFWHGPLIAVQHASGQAEKGVRSARRSMAFRCRPRASPPFG